MEIILIIVPSAFSGALTPNGRRIQSEGHSTEMGGGNNHFRTGDPPPAFSNQRVTVKEKTVFFLHAAP